MHRAFIVALSIGSSFDRDGGVRQIFTHLYEQI
jgi:hypothetical protein